VEARFFAPVQTGSVAHSVSYTVPTGYSGWGVALTTHLHLAQRFNKELSSRFWKRRPRTKTTRQPYDAVVKPRIGAWVIATVTDMLIERKYCLEVCNYFNNIQGGSNMTVTNCDLFTHKSSRSYLNQLLLRYNMK
jgi:hypothetical protein